MRSLKRINENILPRTHRHTHARGLSHTAISTDITLSLPANSDAMPDNSIEITAPKKSKSNELIRMQTGTNNRQAGKNRVE